MHTTPALLSSVARALLLMAALIAVPLVANAQENWSGGSFKILINRDIDGFDHTKSPSPDLARLQVLFAAHDLLFRYHADTGVLEPRLALSAEHSDDYRTWTVRLRPGVKFSNGAPLTAESYAHHFTRLAASPVARQFWAYAGFRPVTVTARDDLTIEFVLQEPSTAFASIMGFPLYIWALNEVGYAKAHENNADYSRTIVGAGPYMLKEWVPGKSVTMVKNPHYWRPEEQRADELVFVVVTGPERANNWATLRAGDVDLDWTSGDLAAWGKTQTEFNFNVGFRSSSGLVLNFNTRKPPFDDPRVRRAMVQAIDRKAVVQIVYQGGQTVADQAFAPGTKWHCDGLKTIGYDPEAAKAALQAYGKPLPKVEIWALTGPFQAAAEVIQEMFRSVGVVAEVKPAGTSPAQISALVSKGEAQTWVLLGGATVHPTTFQMNLASDDPANVWGLKSDRIDTAIARLKAARTESDIKAAHCEFEQAKLDEAPFIYLTYNIAGIFSKKSVGGVRAPTDEMLDLTRIYRIK